MNISDIIIPTLGRINNQVTYNNLPEKYKKLTRFVVQAHEYAEMVKLYGDQVYCLPTEINRIAATREWIFNNWNHTRHLVFDDDLGFVVKEPNDPDADTKWKSREFTEQDYDDAFALLDAWMDDGISYGGMLPAWVIPDVRQWPVRENQRMMTNWFFDGPSIPTDLEWSRVSAAEDFDVNLQLLTRGFRNRISAKYMVSCSETNAAGGCSTWRTLEVHNEAQEKLASLWPSFVKINKKEVAAGPWKGKIKLATTIQHKKAYLSSQINTLEEFFG